MFRLGPPAMLLRIIKPIAALFIKKLYSRVAQRDDLLIVRSGIVFRRRVYISRNRIKCICLDRGIIMRLFNMYSLSVTVSGESDAADSRILLLPLCGLLEAKEHINGWFPQFLSKKGIIRIKGTHFLRERIVYCLTRDVGSIRITKTAKGQSCALKLVLHSRRRNTVKARGLPLENGERLYNKILNNE